MILKSIEACAVTPLANVAVTVLDDVVAAVGVPLMVPVAELSVKPSGRLFLLKDGLLPEGTTVKVMGVIAAPADPFTVL
jgi:hypothetical protein